MEEEDEEEDEGALGLDLSDEEDEDELIGSQHHLEPKLTAVEEENRFHDYVAEQMAFWFSVNPHRNKPDGCDDCQTCKKNPFEIFCEVCKTYNCMECWTKEHDSIKKILHRTKRKSNLFGLDGHRSHLVVSFEYDCGCPPEETRGVDLEIVGMHDGIRITYFSCEAHMYSYPLHDGFLVGSLRGYHKKAGQSMSEKLIAVDLDHLKLYDALSLQEKSLSYWAFYLALQDYLDEPYMMAKKSTWYPAMISASNLYKRFTLESKTLKTFQSESVYTDCKGCDKEGPLQICADGCYATSRLDKKTREIAQNNYIPIYSADQKKIDAYLLSRPVKKNSSSKQSDQLDCQSTFVAVTSNKRFAAMKKGRFEDLNETGKQKRRGNRRYIWSILCTTWDRSLFIVNENWRKYGYHNEN